MSQKIPTTDAPNDEESAAFTAFTELLDYSLLNELNPDPRARDDGEDHKPREVLSGHYVPVTPTPIANPAYLAHSSALFEEIGLPESLADAADFRRVFSGDLSFAQPPLNKTGWATGYALSIYGAEYTQQCPFRTGNGYGDGRAISVVELVSRKTGKRWEMQLKGGGPTPYCRGADGRAVLRSSVREFLAQEFMHALGVPTSRSLSLFASTTETVRRPWYSPGSTAFEPDIMVDNPVAISTRAAPSFLRVGQLELFARRVRSRAHPGAMEELRQIVTHAIQREYRDEIDENLPFEEQVVAFAALYRQRLIELVGHWLRVGYCQGNFNSDNCALGGFTLDYGPFGFMAGFNPRFQPWTGGGQHFSFLNQANAAAANYHMFWTALTHLVPEDGPLRQEFDGIREGFPPAMQNQVQGVFASKLGLNSFDGELVGTLLELMTLSEVDFTIFFRELSHLPADVTALEKSFPDAPSNDTLTAWNAWLAAWRTSLERQHGSDLPGVTRQMKRTNPKYTWREWLVARSYQRAALGDASLLHELQTVFSDPYGEQTPAIEAKFYPGVPEAMRRRGGISHYSCSS